MKGLNSDEVKYRINNGMLNNDVVKYSRNISNILISNILTLFNLIHIILFVFILTTGSLNNGIFIITIFINIFISIYQEIKAKIIIDKLSIINNIKIKAIRNEKINELLPNEIVLEDVLYLKQGVNLVVDAKVIESDNLEINESIITGESNSVTKGIGDTLISGSIVVCGNAYAKVISINKNTYTNNLIKMASTNIDESAYLKKCINYILKTITILIIPIGILLFITQFFFSKQTYVEAILSSVAGVIGMIPDGLVLLTSFSLTIGVVKMASKKVIIQKINGIEMLSCIDVLCLDKTGTITDGSMEVVDVIKIDEDIDFENIVSNMIIDDTNATDLALLKYFNKNNDFEIIYRLPFSSSRKYSLVKFNIGCYVIGALEYITNKSIDDFPVLENYIDNGFRILTLANCNEEFNKNNNTVLGFIVLKDNIRTNAKEILQYFKNQGVEVKIISGDNPKTIYNLLRQLSINGYEKYISGDKLPNDYNELKKMVNSYKIFGRVTPYQKFAIIKALKENFTVGMIGDGVNDILALKEADCGIALVNGVNAIRSVSEIILTESDFSVLPNIVNEGRRIVNNIERVASMYLVKTVYSLLNSIICIILTHEYPFYPIQLTLISITCVGIPSFFLALEPNYNKVNKDFIITVFKNALPSGICVSINVLIIIIYTNIFNLDFELYRTIIIIITGYLNLRLLYKISLPLSLFRKNLILICSICFILLLFFFNEFFLIQRINLFYLTLIVILIFIDNYICLFLERIYDKIVLRIESLKRRKSYCEK